MEIKKETNKKLRRAQVSILAALLAALILLAVTGFAFIDIIRGPVSADTAPELEDGAYVSVDVSADMGIFAEQYTSSGRVTGRYIVVPMGEQLAAFLLPERYFESEEAIREYTYQWINGQSEGLSSYILTVGTVRRLTEREQALMYDWFDLNSSWMTQAGTIGSVEDFTDHLSDYVVCVDYIGGMSAVWVYSLSSLAWLLIIFAIIMGILWALGKFDKRPQVEDVVTFYSPSSDEPLETKASDGDGGAGAPAGGESSVGDTDPDDTAAAEGDDPAAEPEAGGNDDDDGGAEDGEKDDEEA